MHRSAAIGMQSELAFGAGCLVVASSNTRRTRCAFPIRRHTSRRTRRLENVDDDVGSESRPFCGPISLRDIPGPDLRWRLRQQIRAFIDWSRSCCAAPGLHGWRPGCGTWCGSSSGRGFVEAGRRRSRRPTDRRSAAVAEGPARFGVRQAARARSGFSLGDAWPVASPNASDDDRGWRADRFRAATHRREARCWRQRDGRQR